MMDILRFISAGSVDDGKSTLIGRLLYDSKSILTDQLEAIEKQSKNKAQGEIDLALLTDGLRAEREQGITIDVAYKYFSTPKRKFIIADAPGHIQYTRNMVTGASNTDLMVILIDARNGVIEQTRRHSLIASLLRIPEIIVAVNKMDLVNFSQDVFNNIVIDYASLAARLGLEKIQYIPISALQGGNIVEKSESMPWYEGKPLLECLEEVVPEQSANYTNPRFSVQYIIRPQVNELHDYRGYAGKILSGVYQRGDEVVIHPSAQKSRILKIESGGKEVDKAIAPQAAVLHLEDDIDISRGDMILCAYDVPEPTQDIEMMLCWMDNKPLMPGNKYLIQLNSNRVKAVVKDIYYSIDVNTLDKIENPGKAALNDIVKVRIRTASPVTCDAYATLKVNGGAILIDETSNLTVAACMVQ